MRKLKRKKVIREFLEDKLEKYQRRIMAISENAYKLRQQIAALDALAPQKPLTKADREAREKAEREAEIAHNQAQEEAIIDSADQEIGTTPLEDSLTFQNKPTTDEQIQSAAKAVVEGTNAVS